MKEHECCRDCDKNCKQPYTFWSGCMPCEEYCEKFKPKKKEAQPKKIDVVKEMDKIERRESLEEGKKP